MFAMDVLCGAVVNYDVVAFYFQEKEPEPQVIVNEEEESSNYNNTSTSTSEMEEQGTGRKVRNSNNCTASKTAFLWLCCVTQN